MWYRWGGGRGGESWAEQRGESRSLGGARAAGLPDSPSTRCPPCLASLALNNQHPRWVSPLVSSAHLISHSMGPAPATMSALPPSAPVASSSKLPAASKPSKSAAKKVQPGGNWALLKAKIAPATGGSGKESKKRKWKESAGSLKGYVDSSASEATTPTTADIETSFKRCGRVGVICSRRDVFALTSQR